MRKKSLFLLKVHKYRGQNSLKVLHGILAKKMEEGIALWRKICYTDNCPRQYIFIDGQIMRAVCYVYEDTLLHRKQPYRI